MPDELYSWSTEFPRIGLIVEGEEKFYTLGDAVRLWDSGLRSVEDTGKVLEADFRVRRMTPEENRAFERRVDESSASR